MKLLGYEECSVYSLNPNYFKAKSITNSSPYMVNVYPHGYPNLRIRMRTETEAENRLLHEPGKHATYDNLKCSPLHHVLCMPEKGQTLYFDKACTMPRVLCKDTWKRTTSMVNADCIVIPEHYTVNYSYMGVIFYDRVLDIICHAYLTESMTMPTIGQSFSSWHDDNADLIPKYSLALKENIEHRNLFMNAGCIYVGGMINVKEESQFIFNVIDGLYPKVGTEHSLLREIDTDGREFDLTTVYSLIEMLNSSDKDTVKQALKTMSMMDYVHYPATVNYILYKTYYEWHPYQKCSSAVEFMLLTIYKKSNIFMGVGEKEKYLAQELFKEYGAAHIKKYIEELNNKTDFQFTANIDLEFKEEENETKDS